jgi:hypothetical protein
MLEPFALIVLDRDGLPVDVSQYTVNSLEAAASLGHAFQTQDGYSVTIIDSSTDPPREYNVDDRGKPVFQRRD